MTLGRIAGINIKVNPLLLLLIAAYAYLGLVFEVAVIVSALIMHELAHILVALWLGVKIMDIELLPFGGQARIESFTGLEPEKEIYVALAGPATSLFLAAFFYFLPVNINKQQAELLVQANLILGVFNLFPALPLDGGRVLRAALSRWHGYKKATRQAAGLGQLIGVLLTLAGIYLATVYHWGLNIIIIGILLFWSARRERKFLVYAFMRFLVQKKSQLAQNGVLPSYQVVSHPETAVKKILDDIKPVHYLLVVVVDQEHRVRTVLSEAQLIEGLLNHGPHVKLKDL